MPAGTDGVTDMFPVLSFTPAERDTYCMRRWGVTPRQAWMRIWMGGDSKHTLPQPSANRTARITITNSPPKSHHKIR